MANSIRFYPPYSIIFISDEDLESPPQPGERCITANDKALMVPCMAEPDGATTITLRPAGEISRTDEPAFEGVIATPLRRLCVSTCYQDIVLSEKVSFDKTRLRIWANDRSFPDDVLIGFD